MYCKTCGTKNSPGAQFCVQDGAALSREPKAFVHYKHSEFCPACGTKNGAQNQFCAGCGQHAAAALVSEKKGIHVKLPSSFSSVADSTQQLTKRAKGVFSPAEWKRVFTGAAVMLGVWLVIVIGLFVAARRSIEDGLRSSLSMDEWLNVSSVFDAFGFFEYASLTGARSLTGEVNMGGLFEDAMPVFYGTVEAGGITTLLLLGVSALAGSAALLYKNRTAHWGWLHYTQAAVTFGFLYAVLLSVILLIGGGTISHSSDFIQFSAELSFSPIMSFLVNIVYGTVISGGAMLLASGLAKAGHPLRSFSYADVSIRSLITFVTGFAVCTLILTTVFVSTAGKDMRAEEIPGSTILSLEAASGLYPLYHFGRVTGEWTTGMETEVSRSASSVSLGLFSEETMAETEYKDEAYFADEEAVVSLVDNWGLLYTLLLIPAGLMFWSGWQSKGSHQVGQELLQQTALFGGIYAVCMMLLVYWKSVSFSAQIEGEGVLFELASPLVSTVVVTFLFTCVFYFLGAYVKQRTGGHV